MGILFAFAAHSEKRQVRCCSPKQWTTGLSSWQEFGGHRGTANFQLYLDEIGQQIRVDMYATYAGTVYYFNIWEDFEGQQECVQNVVNDQCTCSDFDQDFPSSCIDENYEYATGITIGSQDCEVWQFIDNSNQTDASIVITSDDCIPIGSTLNDPDNGFYVGIYYNVTNGISNFDVFTPCTPTPKRSTDDNEASKAIKSMWADIRNKMY